MAMPRGTSPCWSLQPQLGMGEKTGSAAAAALLGLALVLLDGGFVVTQALEVSEDARLRHLALEATESGFNSFVFADGDLGHEAGIRPR